MSELRASSQARAWELLIDTPCMTSAYEPTLHFIIHGTQTAVLCLEAENLTISITETPSLSRDWFSTLPPAKGLVLGDSEVSASCETQVLSPPPMLHFPSDLPPGSPFPAFLPPSSPP